MAILRFEERVRIERANGLRSPDTCVDNNCGCSPYGSDAEYKGKTFHEVAGQPLRLNAVCPHPKMIVPITGAFIVTEPVKTMEAKYLEQPYRLVDANPCDGRLLGVLETVNDSHASVGIKEAETEYVHTEVVEDTAFDEPNNKKVVRTNVKTKGKATQPIATDGKEAVAVPESKISDGNA